MHAKSLCPALCEPKGSTPPGSTAHGILQVRILEWGALSFSRAFPDAGISLCVLSLLHRRQILYRWATGGAPPKHGFPIKCHLVLKSSLGFQEWPATWLPSCSLSPWKIADPTPALNNTTVNQDLNVLFTIFSKGNFLPLLRGGEAMWELANLAVTGGSQSLEFTPDSFSVMWVNVV